MPSLLSIALLTISILFPPKAVAQERSYVVVNVAADDTLNIRSGPGTNFPVTGAVAAGSTDIKITGDRVVNGPEEWVPITYPGGKGWTRSKFLAPADQQPKPTPANRAGRAETDGERDARVAKHFIRNGSDAELDAKMAEAMIGAFDAFTKNNISQRARKAKVSPNFVRKLMGKESIDHHKKERNISDKPELWGEIFEDAVILGKNEKSPILDVYEGVSVGGDNTRVTCIMTDWCFVAMADMSRADGSDMKVVLYWPDRDPEGELPETLHLFCIPPVQAALLTPQGIVQAMQASINASQVKEFNFGQVISWKAGEDEAVGGTSYQTGLVEYKATTVFGVKTLRAKALIKGGKVAKWIWATSGMEIE